MNETLDEQSRQDLMQYRLQRADEAMEEVDVLTKTSHYNAAVNRLYYACFYATQALLLKYHITANTHAGVKTMLGMHFISKGLLPVKHGKTFNTLFEKRHSSDYEAFTYCDKEMVDDLTPMAASYIAAVKELIDKQ